MQRVRSKFIVVEEAAAFEKSLLDRGFLHVVKEDPEELHPREFLKLRATRKSPEGTLLAKGFTFVWVEKEVPEEPPHLAPRNHSR
ncbi:hypothetical protein [Geobacter sp. DSM 9736]|uniref:hypothetical protein n=1 Tax=Geobacter sp. DSM 9736 TaxID=1277350 RepID=UPI000B504346|nr:hypothetical protein [Geobacter sp. DSM 9736]SNB46219.1 hypothetical protein SAMN06269301_1663 [Geobacter sp. DSM 9736]